MASIAALRAAPPCPYERTTPLPMIFFSHRTFRAAMALVVLMAFATHEAAAWGPHARKAIALASLDLVRRAYDDAFKVKGTTYRDDLLKGAEDGYGILRETLPMHSDSQAIDALFHQIQLMREVRQYGTGSYFAYRMGTLSALAAALVLPYGIPHTPAEEELNAKISETLDAMVGRFSVPPRDIGFQYIRSTDIYFADKRHFLAGDKKILADDLRAGRGRSGFLAEAAPKYFDRALTAVTDSWYTVFRARGESSDIVVSPIIVAEYFINEMEYLLKEKKNFQQAERTYDVFKRINPPDNVVAFERIGDLFYAYGEETSSIEAKERGVREWKIAYGHPGPQRQRASKKLSAHYISVGESFYRKAKGGDAEEGDLQNALLAFNDALEFDRTNEVAASRITETSRAIKERNDRYNMQLAVLNNALLGMQEAERAALNEDYKNALVTYGAVLNSLSIVDSEFKDLEDTKKANEDAVTKARLDIYESVFDRAEQLIAEGDRAVDERRFDDAIGLYNNVDVILNPIPTENSAWTGRKESILEQAQTKIAETNDAKQRYQQEQAAPAAPANPPS